MGTAGFCFHAVKMDLKSLSCCGAILDSPEPHSGPKISFLLDAYIPRLYASPLSSAVGAFSLPHFHSTSLSGEKKNHTVNLNYVRSKSSHEEVMQIEINFIILHRAASVP